MRLVDNDNYKVLELQKASSSSISALQSSSNSGDELKRAVILSSEDHINSLVNEFKQLNELQRYIGQLETIRTTAPSSQHLQQLEETQHTQQESTLVLHARVERLLTAYQEMIHILSEKCVEYNAVLEHLLPVST